MLTLITGALFMSVGCSKSNNNSSSTKDSVLYSSWQSFSLKYEGLDNNSDSVYDQTITAAAITQNVLDKGTVTVYVSDGAGDYADASNAGFSVILNVGSIYISTYGAVPSAYKWRYVVIPGTIATTSQLKGLSYETVAKMLDLK